MALLDGLSRLFASINPMPVPEGVAQDRYTHTPIIPATSTDTRLYGGFYHNLTPLASLPLSGITNSGLNLTQPGVIQMQQDALGRKDILRHEIVHAATVDQLQPGSPVYTNVKRALPKEVQDQVPERWRDFVNTPGFDPVHEGMAWFLTDPNWSDKKYNKAKQTIINAFPQTQRNQLIRMLGVQNAN